MLAVAIESVLHHVQSHRPSSWARLKRSGKLRLDLIPRSSAEMMAIMVVITRRGEVNLV